MKKIITILVLSLFTNAFAGNIYSTDDSVNYYIQVNEVQAGQYQFSVCDKIGTCGPLGKGFTYNEKAVQKLIKKYNSTSQRLIVADIGVGAVVGIGSIWVASLSGFYIGDKLSFLGGIPGIVIGFLVGVGVGVTADILLIKNVLNPKMYSQMATALAAAIDGDTTIERDDIIDLAEVLDKALLKVAR